MFKLKIFCNDGDEFQYWEDGNGTYETYDKALIACYENALQEVQSLMMDEDGYRWFEVNVNFEITDTYVNKCLELGTIIPVATVYYDHAPWDRENECDIEIITGYMIVEIKEE